MNECFGFPNGAAVSLMTESGLYLSTTSDARTQHGVSAGLSPTLRPHRQDWETWRLSCLGDGSYALQNRGHGYLSPINADADRWTFRAHIQAWETFHLEPEPSSMEAGLATRFTVRTVIGGGDLFLSAARGASGDGGAAQVVVTREPVTWWRVRLVEVPLINLASFGRVEALHGEFSRRPHFLGINRRTQQLVRTLLRAMVEIGAFYVVGHGVGNDLFDVVRATAVRRHSPLPLRIFEVSNC